MDPVDPDYPDDIIMYGTTGNTYDVPERYIVVKKLIEATITSDDLSTWDYCEDEELESFTVWNSDGTALWTTGIKITYCYANIAFKVENLVVDGVTYYPDFVGITSVFNAYSEDDHVLTYIGTTLHKVIEAQETDDGTFIGTIPRVLSSVPTVSIPDNHYILDENYIIIAYVDENSENIILKAQPIHVEPND